MARRTETLSPRQREVLSFLAQGLTGEEIAEHLVLSPETIRTHIRGAMKKLRASTRVHAVATAVLEGEIALLDCPAAHVPSATPPPSEGEAVERPDSARTMAA